MYEEGKLGVVVEVWREEGGRRRRRRGKRAVFGGKRRKKWEKRGRGKRKRKREINGRGLEACKNIRKERKGKEKKYKEEK